MSATDPGAATGQPIVEPSRCTCSHLVSLHAINTQGFRAACSKGGPDACGCRLFVSGAAR